jgi:hypothetical protein
MFGRAAGLISTAVLSLTLPFQKMQQDCNGITFRAAPFTAPHSFQLVEQMFPVYLVIMLVAQMGDRRLQSWHIICFVQVAMVGMEGIQG